MSHWLVRHALSRRGSEPVVIACVGSSTTWGSGASTLERGWTAQLARRLREPGRGWSTTYLGSHPGWTFTGSTALVNGGLSTQSRRLAAGAAMSRTIPDPFDALEVLYKQGSANAGAFTVQVGGQSVVVTPSPTGSAERYDGRTVLPVPRGAYTVTITAQATTTIMAVRAIDGATDGVHVVNAGRGGTTSADYSGSLAARTHNRAMALLDPAVLVFMVGSNDYALGVPPEEYKARMRIAVDNARTAFPRRVPVLLVHPFRRFDVTAPAAPWSEYGLKLAELAAEMPDADVLNLSDHYPVSQAKDVGDLISTDAVHQTDAGHSWMADLIGDHLTAPVGAAPPAAPPVTTSHPSTWPDLITAFRSVDLTGVDGDEVVWTPYAGVETSAATAPVGARATLLNRAVAERPAVVTTQGRALQTGAWSRSYNGPLTVVMVARCGSRTVTPGGLLFSGRGGVFVGFQLPGDNLGQFYAGGVSAPAATLVDFGTSGWRALAFVFDGAGSRLHSHDRPVQSAPLVNGTAYGLPGLALGANSSGAAHYSDARFAEVLVFDRAFTVTEADAAVRHLGRLYALDGDGLTSV